MSETVASRMSLERLVVGVLTGFGSASATMDGCKAAAPQHA